MLAGPPQALELKSIWQTYRVLDQGRAGCQREESADDICQPGELTPEHKATIKIGGYPGTRGPSIPRNIGSYGGSGLDEVLSIYNLRKYQ